MQVRTNEFIETRAVLLRVDDCSVYNGWVERWEPPMLTVRATLDRNEQVDRQFLLCLHGFNESVNVPAKVASLKVLRRPMAGQETAEVRAELTTTGDLTASEQRLAARRKVDFMPAELDIDSDVLKVKICDASAFGAGIVLDRKLPVATQATLRVTLKNRVLQLPCELRHCSPDPKLRALFRAGLSILEMTPDDADAWSTLLNS